MKGRTDDPGMSRSQMRLVSHAPSWRRWFEVESRRIRNALPDILLRVQHVGSTSVPDLIAKPIIDIAATVADVEDFERCVAPLSGLGYEYRGQHGEDPLRRYFVLERDGRRVAQLHLWTEGAGGWRAAVAFRDLLRERPDLRASYAAEKLRVAEAVAWDKGAYAVGKGPFIERLLEEEGIW